MKQLLKNAKAIIGILILILSLNGCENNDDNLPEIFAEFTHTINVSTGTVTFINTSSDVKYYLWTFGDGTTSTEINPIKTYPNGTYTVTLRASNVAGASDTFEDTIEIMVVIPAETVRPVITLNGNSTINIAVGGSFTDPGATASDNVDGNITSSIVVGGDTVNVNTAGTYIITYNVSDAAGNAATQVTRTVIVAVDTVRPVITLNGSSTINVAVGGTFTDPGATALDNVDGDITGNIVVGGNTVNVNTPGTYSITYNVSDAAGNAATQVARTVIVAVDTVRPVITLNGSSTINVSVGGTFTDPGATASDNVDGNITSNIVVGGDTVNVNTAGTYSITYNVSDAAGNAATQVTRTVIVAVGGGNGNNLTINGDFETGNITGWTTFVDAQGASFTATSAQASGGAYSGNLVADFEAGTGGAVDAVVKQANMGAGGSVTPNTDYIVSFDIRGSASVGGVFFAEFFSELSGGGVSKAEIITGGPHPLSDNWTSYSYTVRTGSDVNGGITLQLKSSCGPVANCLVDVFFDNVSVKLK